MKKVALSVTYFTARATPGTWAVFFPIPTRNFHTFQIFRISGSDLYNNFAGLIYGSESRGVHSRHKYRIGFRLRPQIERNKLKKRNTLFENFT